MLSDLIHKVAKENNLTYEQVYKMISTQFLHVRQALADSNNNVVCITRIGKFLINKKVLQKRLDALLNYKNKKKYIYDQIDNLLKKGVEPYL